MNKKTIKDEGRRTIDARTVNPITFYSLLKIEDLLKIFGVTRATLNKIIKNRQITAPIKIGKHPRWDPKDIQKDLERMKNNAKTAC